MYAAHDMVYFIVDWDPRTYSTVVESFHAIAISVHQCPRTTNPKNSYNTEYSILDYSWSVPCSHRIIEGAGEVHPSLSTEYGVLDTDSTGSVRSSLYGVVCTVLSLNRDHRTA